MGNGGLKTDEYFVLLQKNAFPEPRYHKIFATFYTKEIFLTFSLWQTHVVLLLYLIGRDEIYYIHLLS